MPRNSSETRPPYLALALGLLLLSPTLFMGFYADDHIHQIALCASRQADGDSPIKPWALYDFGSYQDWQQLEIQNEPFPWWADRDWQIRFFRPLSSVAMWLQYQLFGDWAPGYHLVSLTLFGLLLLATHQLYLSLGFSPSAARRGTLLLAICDSMVLPVGWTANQNSIYVALLAVHSFRLLATGTLSIRRLALGLAAACAAALAKESGSASLLLAILVLLWRYRTMSNESQQAQPRTAIAGASVAALALVLWAATIALGGYGTKSLFYATPWSEPARFGNNLLLLCTSGVAGLYGPVPMDAVTFYPSTYVVFVASGAAIAIPVTGWILWRVRQNACVPWLVLWSILFLGLQAGGPPADRLLFVPAIAVMGLLALFFERQRAERAEAGLSLAAGWATMALWLSVTFGSGTYMALQAAGITSSARYVRKKATTIETGAEAAGRRDILILQAEGHLEAFALQSTLANQWYGRDISFWTLQFANRPLRWTRVDETTFDLESLGSPFLSSMVERVYLTREPDLTVGHRWRTALFSVEVMTLESGLPKRLRIRLPRSLNAPNLLFVRSSSNGRYTTITPPSVGSSIELPSPPRVGPYMP